MQYYVDDYGTLHIFDNNGHSVADISECSGMNETQINQLIDDVVNER